MPTLRELSAALLTVGVPVSHYHAVKQPDKYIVWAEDGQAGAVWGDNRMQEQALSGTVDYYTRDEFDNHFRRIQQAMDGIGLSYRLNSVQDENELIARGIVEGELGSGYIHYEWVWGIWLG